MEVPLSYKLNFKIDFETSIDINFEILIFFLQCPAGDLSNEHLVRGGIFCPQRAAKKERF